MRAFILHSPKSESARLDFDFLYIPAPIQQGAFQSLKYCPLNVPNNDIISFKHRGNGSTER